jgi:hypothetical protein
VLEVERVDLELGLEQLGQRQAETHAEAEGRVDLEGAEVVAEEQRRIHRPRVRHVGVVAARLIDRRRAALATMPAIVDA